MMRARPLALLLLLSALTGCPAVLSDWTIAAGPTDDASADAGGPDAAGNSSSGPGRSLDASLDPDVGPTPEEAAAPDSGPEASESGSSVSGPNDSGPTDRGPCDGGPFYTHHVGVAGLTWQDCVPTGTYNSTQAVAACEAYSASVDAGFAWCYLPPGTCEYSSEFQPDVSGLPTYFWTYDGQTSVTGAGHVADIATTRSPGGCPSADDPMWD
jgi:hypothetical protein